VGGDCESRGRATWRLLETHTQVAQRNGRIGLNRTFFRDLILKEMHFRQLYMMRCAESALVMPQEIYVCQKPFQDSSNSHTTDLTLPANHERQKKSITQPSSLPSHPFTACSSDPRFAQRCPDQMRVHLSDQPSGDAKRSQPGGSN
jgi:hypothetical protein